METGMSGVYGAAAGIAHAKQSRGRGPLKNALKTVGGEALKGAIGGFSSAFGGGRPTTTFHPVGAGGKVMGRGGKVMGRRRTTKRRSTTTTTVSNRRRRAPQPRQTWAPTSHQQVEPVYAIRGGGVLKKVGDVAKKTVGGALKGAVTGVGKLFGGGRTREYRGRGPTAQDYRDTWQMIPTAY
jgi:hypothetical protein